MGRGGLDIRSRWTVQMWRLGGVCWGSLEGGGVFGSVVFGSMSRIGYDIDLEEKKTVAYGGNWSTTG